MTIKEVATDRIVTTNGGTTTTTFYHEAWFRFAIAVCKQHEKEIKELKQRVQALEKRKP